MAACLVLKEQMPKVNMPSHLIQMKASFPEELLNLFENMEGAPKFVGIATAKWQAPRRSSHSRPKPPHICAR